MPVVSSRDFGISYQVEGSGPPLILVSGFSQWAEQWVSAGYVAALRDGFRVIRIDPLGHGDSERPHDPEAYRWELVIGDLLAVADAEGIDKALWWGFSRGSDLVQDLAFLHPSRVAGCVLGSGTATFGAGDWPVEPVPTLLRSTGGPQRVWSVLGFDDPDEVAEALRRNDPEALACVLEGSGAGPDFDAYPPPIPPVLSYKGSRETYSEEMKTFLDNVNAVRREVADSNHYQAFVRSTEVLAFVEPFLASVAGQTHTTVL